MGISSAYQLAALRSNWLLGVRAILTKIVRGKALTDIPLCNYFEITTFISFWRILVLSCSTGDSDDNGGDDDFDDNHNGSYHDVDDGNDDDVKKSRPTHGSPHGLLPRPREPCGRRR